MSLINCVGVEKLKSEFKAMNQERAEHAQFKLTGHITNSIYIFSFESLFVFCTNFQGVEKLKSKLNVLNQEKANPSNSNSIRCIGFNFYFLYVFKS